MTPEMPHRLLDISTAINNFFIQTVNKCHRALKWLSYALVNFLQAFGMVVLSKTIIWSVR